VSQSFRTILRYAQTGAEFHWSSAPGRASFSNHPRTAPESFEPEIGWNTPKRPASYQPLRGHLREFRTLKLLPGSWLDEICCELHVASLDARPKYEAVSYVWGNCSSKGQIRLDGENFLVTSNMEAVLRRLRHRENARSLWLDAICIDQTNLEERSLQVTLLRDIFLDSQAALVMLGEVEGTPIDDNTVWHNDMRDASTLENALRSLKALGHVPFALTHTLEPDYALGAFCFIRLLAEGKHLREIPFLWDQRCRENVFRAISSMMQSPWWSRIWVIQELVLAPQASIFYGHLTAPWSMVANAAENYERHRSTCCRNILAFLPRPEVDTIAHFSRTVLDFDQVRHHWNQDSQSNLLQLLWQFRSRKSTHPIDKVYALLGLANSWGRRRPIVPDYTLTLHQVYRQVVRELIGVTNCLSILNGTLEKSGHLPSWVPDWRTPTDPLELQRLRRIDLYNASNGKMPFIRLLGDDVLETAASKIDVVAAVSDVMLYTGEPDPQKTFRQWYSLAGLDHNPERPYVAGGTWIDAYWRTLCGDSVFNGEIGDYAVNNCYSRAGPEYSSLYGFWSRVPDISSPSLLDIADTTEVDLVLDTVGSAKQEIDTAHIDHAIRSATANRRFFLTKSGYMGLAPPSTLVGDKVYVFLGGRTPFIVRKIDFDPGKSFYYTLIGDCYLHGVMDGEALSLNYEKQRYISLV